VGVWLVDKVYRAADQSVTQSVAMLLVPTVVLAAAAAVMLLVPRPLKMPWGAVFLFAILGVPAWFALHPTAATRWLSPGMSSAISWMTLGALAYLILVTALVLRKRPGPSGESALWSVARGPGAPPLPSGQEEENLAREFLDEPRPPLPPPVGLP